MPSLTFLICLLALSVPACTGASIDQLRREIDAEIQLGVEATRSKDIDTYMAQMPPGATIVDEAGNRISREDQRRNVLRDWSIIDSTVAIDVNIDSLASVGDSVIVFTSQRWERLMFQRDGRTLDTVITTQRHREVWARTSVGWRGIRTEELGGEVWINGRRYVPNG